MNLESDLHWHTQSAEEAQQLLHTSDVGLSSTVAEERLATSGPNLIEEEKPPTTAEMLIDQFRSPLVILLLVAGGIMVAIGEPIDASVILIVVLVNAIIGFVQERQAEQSVQAVKELMTPVARVIRDGREREIDSRTIVPGDLISLESGALVPADLRLIATTGLQVDESLLTGESVPVSKSPDAVSEDTVLAERSDMAYAGTSISRGRGRGLVVSTGGHTELGSIADEMREVERRTTPLQRRLDRLAKVVGIIVAVAAVAAFAGGVAAGRSTSEMFLVAVAVAVSAVPEGLPIAFTITLSVGVRHMANRNAIVRRLPVVETLGSTTVIGSDKTGTLTENRMTVQTLWTHDGEESLVDLGGSQPLSCEWTADGKADIPTMTAMCGVLTNEALIDTSSVEPETTGDPTEAALLMAALRMGLDPNEVQRRHPLIVEVPFEPERAFSAAVRDVQGSQVLFVKGAPERILTACSHMLLDSAEVPVDQETIHDASQHLASAGQRVLAMAYRPLSEESGGFDSEILPDDLVFLGLQGMTDPPRQGAAEAVKSCREAGVRTLMITGDHVTTARSISANLGIESSSALTGPEIADLDDDELDQAVATVNVYARVTPDQKLRIVHALQRNGEVVAVTGDGVNDAPALRASDIGVAMGKRGTDVAKEASDMILADDRFATIVSAIEEGRVTFDNVRKVVSFLFTTNAAEILIILVALLANWPLPMIAVQILWLNLVTDSLQVMALAFEGPEPDVMDRKPRGRDSGILSPALWQRVGISGVVMTIGTLALFRWELDRGASEEVAQTVALTTMVLYQMFQAFNARSETRSLFQMPFFGNRLLFVAVAAALVIHAAALYLPVTQYFLRVEPLSLREWSLAIIVALTIIVAVELHKWYGRRRDPVQLA